MEQSNSSNWTTETELHIIKGPTLTEWDFLQTGARCGDGGGHSPTFNWNDVDEVDTAGSTPDFIDTEQWIDPERTDRFMLRQDRHWTTSHWSVDRVRLNQKTAALAMRIETRLNQP